MPLFPFLILVCGLCMISAFVGYTVGLVDAGHLPGFLPAKWTVSLPDWTRRRPEWWLRLFK